MIESDIVKTIRRHRMLSGVRSICVACSGGPDSTALLYFLADYIKPANIQLSVAHVNHSLRGTDSERDEKFVRQLADSFSVPFYLTKVNVRREAKSKRLSIEEAARNLRYAYFVKLAKEERLDAIALAHTMDDQAETVLMRILSGSGIQGLGASRPVFSRDKIKFIRPFIEITKSDILKFLKKRKIAFRHDKSNDSTQFVRNRIRLELIPLLERKFSPGIKKVLARLPSILAEDIDFLNREALKYYKKLKKQTDGGILFLKRAFEKLPEAIQFRLLQLALREHVIARMAESRTKQSTNRDCFDNVLKASRKDQVFEFESKHWFSFREMLQEKSKFEISFPGNVVCLVSKKTILVGLSKLSKKDKKNSFRYTLRLGQKIKIPESGVTIQAKKLSERPRDLKKSREDFAVIDGNHVQFPLQIRTRQSGDLFQPLGQSKPSRLKDFLIRRKIPQLKRDQLPLVFSKKKMIWVSGVAVSDLVKVKESTQFFLELRVHPA